MFKAFSARLRALGTALQSAWQALRQRLSPGATPALPAVLSQVRFMSVAAAPVAPTGVFGNGPALQLNRANGGRKPVKVELLVVDDLTASAANRAQVIQAITQEAFQALGKAVLEVKFGYLGSRDRDYQESDELRVIHGGADQVLREQLTVVRAGGGDAAETFGDSLIDALDNYPFSRAPDVVAGVLLLCTDHSKPTRQGLSLTEVGERFKTSRTHVFVVGERGSNTEEIVPAAGAFGGGFIELSAQADPDEIKVVAQKLTGTMVGTFGNASTGTIRISPSGTTIPNP